MISGFVTFAQRNGIVVGQLRPNGKKRRVNRWQTWVLLTSAKGPFTEPGMRIGTADWVSQNGIAV